MKPAPFHQASSLSLLLFLAATLMSITSLASAEKPDVLFFGSDVHGNIGNLNNRLNACAGPYELAGLCGDHENYAEATSALSAHDPGMIQIISQGNNDPPGSFSHATGAVTNLSGNKYYDIYVINWDDFPSANTKLRNYLANYRNGKVIFVMSHAPLHSKRPGLNQTAATAIFQTLQTYGKTLDIVFLWGHNHRQEDYEAGVKRIAVPDKTIWDRATINNTLNANAREILKFTSVNAGYIQADNAATVIQVDDDEINITRCANPSLSEHVDRKRCTRIVQVNNLIKKSAFVAQVTVSFRRNGEDYSLKKEFPAGQSSKMEVPCDATDIVVKAKAVAGTTIFTDPFPRAESKCYDVWGTTLNNKWSHCTSTDGCSKHITIKNNGAYVARATVTYSLNGQDRPPITSGDTTAGEIKRLPIPCNATNIRLSAKAVAGETIITKAQYGFRSFHGIR